MKIYFLTQEDTPLANPQPCFLTGVKKAFQKFPEFELAIDVEKADALILDEGFDFRNFNYINKLLKDPILGKLAHKTYTINNDDWANGLLKGNYSTMPFYRFNPKYHRAVSFNHYPNQFILDKTIPKIKTQKYLASWRGNPQSHPRTRNAIIDLGRNHPRLLTESTTSWCNHSDAEKKRYLNLMLDAKFALCPRGLSPVSARFFEAMALGICPVIISDEYIFPKGPQWEDFAIVIKEKDLKKLVYILEKEEHRAEALGRKARENWERYCSPERIYTEWTKTLIELIKNNKDSDLNSEIARWKSHKTFKDNEWTLPQRFKNRIKLGYKRLVPDYYEF